MACAEGSTELVTQCTSPLHLLSNDHNSKQLSPITPTASTIHSPSAYSFHSQLQQIGVGGSGEVVPFAFTSSLGGGSVTAGEMLCIAERAENADEPLEDASKLTEFSDKPPFTEEEILEELEELRLRSQFTSRPFNRRILPILARYQLREKWGPAAEPYADRLVTEDGSVVDSFLPELQRIRERRQRLTEAPQHRPLPRYVIPPPPLQPLTETSNTQCALGDQLVAADHFTRLWMETPYGAVGHADVGGSLLSNGTERTTTEKRIPDVFSSPQTPTTPRAGKIQTSPLQPRPPALNRSRTMTVSRTIDFSSSPVLSAADSRTRNATDDNTCVSRIIDYSMPPGHSADDFMPLKGV